MAKGADHKMLLKFITGKEKKMMMKYLPGTKLVGPAKEAILMEWRSEFVKTLGVNFINVLCARFSYESLFKAKT